jgi:CBS domain-containing protein
VRSSRGVVPLKKPGGISRENFFPEFFSEFIFILDGEQLAGMITDRDIVVRAIAKGKDPRGMPAREASSRELVTVGPDHDLSDALQLMAQHQVRRLPVVDDENRLVGVVSQADVALEAKDKSVGEMLAEISKPPQGPRQL